MPFHLEISAQRDLSSTSAAERADQQSLRCRIATFQITGKLSGSDRQKLQHQVETLEQAEADTIIIDLLDVSTADQSEAHGFCDWISRVRRTGKSLHVAARQREVHRLINEIGDQPDWLLPFSGAELGAGRKLISLEGLNPSTKKPIA